MATKQEVQALRSKMTDSQVAKRLYDTDDKFRSVVDSVNSSMPKMTAVERAKLPTYLIDRVYEGSFYPGTNKPTTGTQQAMVRLNTQQKQLAEQGAMGQYASLLDANPIESASLGGFAVNILKSGGRLVRDFGTAVMNPIDTAKGLGKAALGGGINAIESIAGDEQLFNNPLGSEDVASSIGQMYVERYGGLENLKKTAYEDPIGLLSDVATVVTGVAGGIKGAATLAGKATGVATNTATKLGTAGRVVRGVQNAADTVGRVGMMMEPTVQAARAVGGVAKGIGNSGKFVVSQATGLAPETITAVARNPQFKAAKAGQITRTTLGEKAKAAIKTLQDEVSDTGKGYEPIRQVGKTIKVAPKTFRETLKSKGFKLDEGGRVIESFDGPQLTAAEIGELNAFLTRVDDLGEYVTPNQFLRIREKLSDLAEYDRANRANDNLALLSEDLRQVFNETSGKEIPGLRELDAQFSPQKKFLELVKKDFIDPQTGELRDNAIPRIATSTTKEGTQFLKRLKELVPGIEDEVNALRAIEDVRAANGQKVGTYTRAAIGGAGLATGNIPVIIGSILSTPSVATRFIRGYGRATGLASSTTNGILNRLRMGKKLTAEQAAIMSAALQWAEIQDSIPQE